MPFKKLNKIDLISYNNIYPAFESIMAQNYQELNIENIQLAMMTDTDLYEWMICEFADVRAGICRVVNHILLDSREGTFNDTLMWSPPGTIDVVNSYVEIINESYARYLHGYEPHPSNRVKFEDFLTDAKDDEISICTFQRFLFKNDRLYAWMKKEYSDACSTGDLKINFLLDEAFIGEFNACVHWNDPSEIEDLSMWIEYIADSYRKYYAQNREADPFRSEEEIEKSHYVNGCPP